MGLSWRHAPGQSGKREAKNHYSIMLDAVFAEVSGRLENGQLSVVSCQSISDSDGAQTFLRLLGLRPRQGD